MKSETPYDLLQKIIATYVYPLNTFSKNTEKGRPGEVIEKLTTLDRDILKTLTSPMISEEKIGKQVAWYGYCMERSTDKQKELIKIENKTLKIKNNNEIKIDDYLEVFGINDFKFNRRFY